MHETRRIEKNISDIRSELGSINETLVDFYEGHRQLASSLMAFISYCTGEVFLSQKEVADLLGVDERTVRNWKTSGKLLPEQAGTGRLYAKSKVLQYGRDKGLIR